MSDSIFSETMVEMAWPQVEDAIKRQAIVLFPLGVIEEHGPHMNLGVDIVAACLVARLTKHNLEARGISALIAPPYYWGINGLTSSFPGSFFLKPETMKAVIMETLESLRSWGVMYVFMLNWHMEGKHNRIILETAHEGRSRLGIKSFYLVAEGQAANFGLNGKEDYVLFEKSATPGYSFQFIDVHAGASETAALAAFFPEQVDLALAGSLKASQITLDDLQILRKGGDAARKLIPAGYIGDPAGFDLTAGRREVEQKARNYADLIESEIKRTR